MSVTVGTFNLNNLFSRFDFTADVSTASPSPVKVEQRTEFSFSDPTGFKLRTYMGRLVKGKPEAERKLIADRIKRMDLDVLAVQEVEDIDTLRQFVRDDLAGLYPHAVLIEGNDPRLIDIAVMSKLPLGGVTSWQQTPDPLNPAELLFSRDLLQVEVLSEDRQRRLFTIFNNHLKSNYVPYDAKDPVAEKKRADELRRRQCEGAAAIIAAQIANDGAFVITGDMNDGTDSAFLEPLISSPSLRLASGLAGAKETRPCPGDTPPPTTEWTERFKPPHQPPVYTLMDQIWLSPELAARKTGAFIDRRTRLGGDGSDHDAAWVALDLTP